MRRYYLRNEEMEDVVMQNQEDKVHQWWVRTMDQKKKR